MLILGPNLLGPRRVLASADDVLLVEKYKCVPIPTFHLALLPTTTAYQWIMGLGDWIIGGAIISVENRVINDGIDKFKAKRKKNKQAKQQTAATPAATTTTSTQQTYNQPTPTMGYLPPPTYQQQPYQQPYDSSYQQGFQPQGQLSYQQPMQMPYQYQGDAFAPVKTVD